MTTCSNCDTEAAFLVEDPGANALYFCRMHLPLHLLDRAQAGQFDIPVATSKKS